MIAAKPSLVLIMPRLLLETLAILGLALLTLASVYIGEGEVGDDCLWFGSLDAFGCPDCSFLSKVLKCLIVAIRRAFGFHRGPDN